MPEHGHATGVLEGKIDSLVTAVQTSRDETTLQLNRLSDKIDEATVSIIRTKGSQRALQKQLDDHETNDRHSFNRLWQIIIGAGVISGGSIGLAKVAQGFLG